MKRFKYLIVGGGMTADSAIRSIRKLDPDSTIAMFCDESDPPYDRPPLSKGLWKGKQFSSIWRSPNGLDIDMHLGQKIVSIDAAKKSATDASGNDYVYEKLLLATGGSVRRLPDADDSVIYFRTAGDYRKLRALCETRLGVRRDRRRLHRIGNSRCIGHERQTGNHDFSLQRDRVAYLSASLMAFLNSYFEVKGVKLLDSETVKSVRAKNGKTIVTTGKGIEIAADGVVAGLGILPNTGLAEQSGLTVDNGIVVDELLRTSNPDIYAAGDVANFYSAALDKRMRVEHEDNANVMGELAGRNMTGQTDIYSHQPYFYSDLFDLGYEAVGELDSGMDIVEDWKETFRKGVIYYLRDGRVRGVLLWNTWGQVAAATQLIAEKSPHNPLDSAADS